MFGIEADETTEAHDRVHDGEAVIVHAPRPGEDDDGDEGDEGREADGQDDEEGG